jgi:hypothetical protein
MLKVKTVLRFGKVLLGTVLVVSLAGPAFAGNVWSWRTEDGTYAFTDDSKRIPAKHQAEAKRKTMGKLTRYERFTELSAESEKPYAERIRERRSELRHTVAAAPMGATAGAMRTQDVGVSYDIRASGNRTGSGLSINVPVNGGGSSTDSGSEPTTIESIRVQPKPSESLASRHWTVVKKGDRIVTVIKGEQNNKPLRATPESDFDLE